MESKALLINKTFSILPWLLLLVLGSTAFLHFLSRPSINPFIISSTNQTLISTNTSSIHTNITSHEDINQIPPLHVLNITVQSQNPKLSDGSGETCDVFSGNWVKDTRGPIYTNLTCPTIPDDDNCWLYGKDQGYTYWKWKPVGCELKRLEPRGFLNVVRGKKMAFVGDSLARNHMESLLCILTQEETPVNIFKDRKNEFTTWYFASYNFTMMALRTNFLIEGRERIINGTKTDSFDLHVDKPSSEWTTKLQGVHYAIISSGNWFIRKNYIYENDKLLGCIHCDDEGVTHLTREFAVRRVFRTTLEFISKNDAYKGMHTLLRTYTPHHFENGAWFSGGECKRTQPLNGSDATLTESTSIFWKIQREEVERVRQIGSNKIGVLDVTRVMMARADAHPGSKIKKFKNVNDCLHWCLPGPVDTWNDVLLHIIEKDSVFS